MQRNYQANRRIRIWHLFVTSIQQKLVWTTNRIIAQPANWGFSTTNLHSVCCLCSLSLPFLLRVQSAFVFCHQVQSAVVSPGENELAFSPVQRLRTSPSYQQSTATETAADRVPQSRSPQVTWPIIYHLKPGPGVCHQLVYTDIFWQNRKHGISEPLTNANYRIHADSVFTHRSRS